MPRLRCTGNNTIKTLHLYLLILMQLRRLFYDLRSSTFTDRFFIQLYSRHSTIFHTWLNWFSTETYNWKQKRKRRERRVQQGTKGAVEPMGLAIRKLLVHKRFFKELFSTIKHLRPIITYYNLELNGTEKVDILSVIHISSLTHNTNTTSRCLLIGFTNMDV